MPLLSPFAHHSLMQQGGSFEPQRISNFAVIIPGLDNDEVLILSLKSATLPGLSMARQGIKYFNSTSNYAGSLAQSEGFQLEYRDYLDRDTLGTLSRWYRRVYDPNTGAIGWARDYKRDGSLFLLPPGMPAADAPGAVDSREFLDRTYVLRGCWPMDFKYPQLDHDDDGGNTVIEFNLSVDVAYPKAFVS